MGASFDDPPSPLPAVRIRRSRRRRAPELADEHGGFMGLKPNINEDIIWISWGYPHVLVFDKPADGMGYPATLFSTQMRS